MKNTYLSLLVATLACTGLQAQSNSQGNIQQSQSMAMSFQTSEGNLQFSFNNGEFSGTFNGEPISQDQLEEKGGSWIVKDKDGNPVATFQAGGLPGQQSWQTWQSIPGNVWEWSGDSFVPHTLENYQAILPQFYPGFDRFYQGGEEPPVRIGITYDKVNPVLAAHLDIDADATLHVTSVEEGSAAAEAGLLKDDLILAIDGNQEATGKTLAAVLMGKKAGDPLSLGIMRRGREVELQLTCQENTEKSQYRFWRSLAPDSEQEWEEVLKDSSMNYYWPGSDGSFGDLHKQLQDSFMQNFDQDLHEQINKSLEEALKGWHESIPQNSWNSMRLWKGLEDDQQFWVPQDTQNPWFSNKVPGSLNQNKEQNNPPKKGSEDRLAALEERLGRLESMLEKLVEKLDD